MANEQAAPSGPDFTHGVPLEKVTEGQSLLGHVGGEPALLVRSGGKLHAVGATCPHYGGPLAEGAVVNGTIRCPWHHSAFDLETGRVECPPSLHDIPCWNIEERDGCARATTRREPAAVRESNSRTAPASVVVIGGGAAGVVAVGTLRKSGYSGPVTLVTGESTPPVDRPNLSKDYLAGSAPHEWMPLHPDEWYAEQKITIIAGNHARQLDLAKRQVVLEDGRTIPFGALLLATGAEPIRLPLGDDGAVHYLRSWSDSDAIIARAGSAKRAVLIGASFIALEVAASLRARGLEVTVVAPEAQPLERVLGTELGAVVRELHESKGVRFLLGRTARAADARGVTLDDGTNLEADLVIAGVGVRPNLALAEAAGLKIDRGIVVNEFLETSAPDVFAAGDIARWPDPHSGKAIRVEHWVVAERQGQTAARNILGAREQFDAVPFFWSAHYDTTISYVGHAEKPDRTELDGDPRSRDCTVRYFEGDRLAAVATIGRDIESLSVEAELERQR